MNQNEKLFEVKKKNEAGEVAVDIDGGNEHWLKPSDGTELNIGDVIIADYRPTFTNSRLSSYSFRYIGKCDRLTRRQVEEMTVDEFEAITDPMTLALISQVYRDQWQRLTRESIAKE